VRTYIAALVSHFTSNNYNETLKQFTAKVKQVTLCQAITKKTKDK